MLQPGDRTTWVKIPIGVCDRCGVDPETKRVVGVAAQRLGVPVRSFTQPYQPSPKGSSGRPAHRPLRGLLGVHSRYGLHTRAVTVFRDTLSEGFSHFVTSMTAPVASGWSVRRVGLAPTGKRRLVTAHTQCRHFASRQERQARPLVVGCSTETGSDAGKVFLRASSSASSWRLRLSLSPSS
jgi:hypothetical protein